MTTIYVVRHGESVANHDNRLAGSRNIPLTVTGREQARRAAEFLRTVPLDAVYSSDLSRAMETAQTIAAVHGLPVIREPGLREINGGAWEGMTYPEIRAKYPEEYRLWADNIGLSRCPGGESALQVQARARSAIEAIVQHHPDSCLCLVTHGLVTRMMEAVWTHIPPENIRDIPFVSNASVSVVAYENGVGVLLQRNLCDHLSGLVTNIQC